MFDGFGAAAIAWTPTVFPGMEYAAFAASNRARGAQSSRPNRALHNTAKPEVRTSSTRAAR